MLQGSIYSVIMHFMKSEGYYADIAVVISA